MGAGALKPDFVHEAALGGRVAGVDEAGRGPWAGPVVAAAVVLDPARIPPGLNDSKQLSAARRAVLFDEIMAVATVGVGIVEVAEIERINILQATFVAMTRAVAPLDPDHVLVDGNRAPLWYYATQTVVGGDGRCLSIAAASIIAKVTRDRIMEALAADFPGYGWAANKGYGTPEHSAGLDRLGVTIHHRRSYAPIAKRIV